MPVRSDCLDSRELLNAVHDAHHHPQASNNCQKTSRLTAVSQGLLCAIAITKHVQLNCTIAPTFPGMNKSVGSRIHHLACTE
jgi:hypothetical protein